MGIIMEDRLVWLLKCFTLKARVFQAGVLCRSSHFDRQDGLGYIHIFSKGKLQLDTACQGRLVIDQPSLFFYMNPTTHHLQPLDGEVDMVCASFEFSTGMKNPLAQALPDLLVLKLADTPSLQASLDMLFTEAQESHCGRQAILDRLIEVVIVQLLRDLMDEGRLDFGLLAGLAHDNLMKAINAIHAKPSYGWSMSELATIAGMSRSRFINLFRDIVGVTPGSYLTEWRMGVAQSLLSKGKSVQLIADMVGYSNASALSRVFTAQVGISPTEWRKQYLNRDK